jgi:hypothetical protein
MKTVERLGAITSPFFFATALLTGFHFAGKFSKIQLNLKKICSPCRASKKFPAKLRRKEI